MELCIINKGDIGCRYCMLPCLMRLESLAAVVGQRLDVIESVRKDLRLAFRTKI